MPGKSNKIADRLRIVRTMKGMTRTEVAESIGCSQTSIRNWEKYGNVSLINAEKLADIYDISLDELCGRTPISF